MITVLRTSLFEFLAHLSTHHPCREDGFFIFPKGVVVGNSFADAA
jgi:hypothetical protein